MLDSFLGVFSRYVTPVSSQIVRSFTLAKEEGSVQIVRSLTAPSNVAASGTGITLKRPSGESLIMNDDDNDNNNDSFDGTIILLSIGFGLWLPYHFLI